MKITPLDEWICRKISCPPGELSRQKIELYQLARVNETLHYCREKSKFYQSLYRNFPERLVSLDELSIFPFTTSDDLQHFPEDMVCSAQGEISRIVTLNTSGTIGAPKRVFFTPEDQELTIDFFGVGMSNLVTAGDRVLILLPDRTPGSVGDLLFLGLQRIGVRAYKHGPVTNLEETLRTVCQLDINCLVGNPTQVLALVRCQQRMPDMFPVKIKSILLSTDYVPEAIAETIRNCWKCDVFNHYGTTEMGLGGGVFCEGQYGYHLREADMYVEIIDPLSGKSLPTGEMGEVVFTTLTRQGMPLMRYRTGDYSKFLSDPCPCGTILKSLQKVGGRVEQHFNINGQQFLIADLDEILFSIDGLINYQLKISHEETKDVLELTLFALKTENEELKADVISTLLSKGIISSTQSISCVIIEGYPEELWSLRKRKVLEEFRN